MSALACARSRLRREGLSAATIAAGLAVAAEAMTHALGKTPYVTQLQAARLLLEGRLAEMATGEGKTLAAALAAAVGALAGNTVHVLTANDYLVARDEEQLAPFYAALGLRSATVLPGHARDERARAYRCDIVHVTARELVFDYLNDHVRLSGERDALVLGARRLAGDGRDGGDSEAGTAAADTEPVVPALAFALVDEADSILLDEAVTPLILSSAGHPLDLAGYRRAFEIAHGLAPEHDFVIDAPARVVQLSDAGRRSVAARVEGAGGVLRPLRRAEELVEAALAARHLYRRDRDYAVVDAAVVLIDETTGRIAHGRRWQGALQAMVEIGEGIVPRAPAVTAARMTYQAFFPRYRHLGGMSGTLVEARRELARIYRLATRRVPLALPDRRRWLGERTVVDEAAKWRYVVGRIAGLVAAGRPVLVGTDSVASSRALSRELSAAGIAHVVLNAVQNAGEAAVIAAAGQPRAVTVATNIAGRGTDIVLDERAAAAGGLHVIAALRNRSRRIDRQLIGRGARQGDAGSGESVVALDDPLLVACWPGWTLRLAARFASGGFVPRWLARPLVDGAQRLAEWHDRSLRGRLRRLESRASDWYGWFGRME